MMRLFKPFALLLGGLIFLAASAAPAIAVDWERTSKAVVKIYNVSLWEAGKVQIDTANEKDLEVPIAIPQMGHGSGVIMTDGCVIATNRHVVEGAIALAVKLEGIDFVFPARVVHTVADDDIAFMLIDTPICKTHVLKRTRTSNKTLARGDDLVVLGYPIDVTAKSASLTRGAFSRYAEHPRIGTLLQTDAAINPGNSGGPVFSDDGRFLGISVARRNNAEGMNYVIPGQRVLDNLEKVLQMPALSEAAMKLRSINEGLYEMVARIAVEMIEAGAMTTREGFGAMRDIFNPWMERMDDFENYGDDELIPEVRVMIAGIYWDMGIASLTQQDPIRSKRYLTQSVQMVGSAVRQQRDLNSNPFVRMALSYRDPRVMPEGTGEPGPPQPPGRPGQYVIFGEEIWPELNYSFGMLIPSEVPAWVSRTQPLMLSLGVQMPVYRKDWFTTGIGARFDYIGLVAKDTQNNLSLSYMHLFAPELLWLGRFELGVADPFIEAGVLLGAGQESIDGDFVFMPGANVTLGVHLADWVRIGLGMNVLDIGGSFTAMPLVTVGLQPQILLGSGGPRLADGK